MLLYQPHRVSLCPFSMGCRAASYGLKRNSVRSFRSSGLLVSYQQTQPLPRGQSGKIKWRIIQIATVAGKAGDQALKIIMPNLEYSLKRTR